MDFEIVVPDRDAFPAPMRPVQLAFGMTDLDEEELGDERLQWEAMRPLAARRGEEWLGGAADYSFELTLPGGTTVPAAGVTMVGVHPGHRRQGILTALMARQLDEIAARGEPVAVLTASESSIYGRFGYGPAATSLGIEIETAFSAFRAPPRAPGRCRMVDDKDEAISLSRAVYDQHRFLRPGSVTHIDWMWEYMRRDRARFRHGATARFWLLHEGADGRPDGFASYRIRESYVDGLPESTVVVEDIVGLGPEVEAALWRFVLDLDLVKRVEAEHRPVDDPLRWRLVEPRRLRTKPLFDWLWLRVVDVAVTLAARRYELEDALVLDVVDRFRPASGGRFALDAGPAGADCHPTDAAPDLTLGAEDLGSAVLGGVALSTLAAAGRVDEHVAGALARADRLLASPLAPFCNTHF